MDSISDQFVYYEVFFKEIIRVVFKLTVNLSLYFYELIVRLQKKTFLHNQFFFSIKEKRKLLLSFFFVKLCTLSIKKNSLAMCRRPPLSKKKKWRRIKINGAIQVNKIY